MQARLEIRRFPVTLVAIAFAVAVALLFGLGIGYALKSTVVTTAPARVLVLGSQSSTSGDDSCVWINHHKGC